MRKMRIVSYPRIHVTLIGMSHISPRLNGGVGFSVSSPNLICDIVANQEIIINDQRKHKLSDNEKNRLVSLLREIMNELRLEHAIHCIISGNVYPHSGLGSSTMLYLSCTEALLIVNNRCYTPQMVQRLSKRGGTSGIGINTYFGGGVVLDSGIKNDAPQNINPSSIASHKSSPLLISQSKAPSWRIGLWNPIHVERFSESEEIDFFHNHEIEELNDIYKIMYESVCGVMSSILENDQVSFSRSIDKIQKTAWKSSERRQYGSEIENLDKKLHELGASCVGMSSLGPLLYFIAPNVEYIIIQLKKEFPQDEFYATVLNNNPRRILM